MNQPDSLELINTAINEIKQADTMSVPDFNARISQTLGKLRDVQAPVPMRNRILFAFCPLPDYVTEDDFVLCPYSLYTRDTYGQLQQQRRPEKAARNHFLPIETIEMVHTKIAEGLSGRSFVVDTGMNGELIVFPTTEKIVLV